MHRPHDPRDEKTLGERPSPKAWVTPTLKVLPVPTTTRGGTNAPGSPDGGGYFVPS